VLAGRMIDIAAPPVCHRSDTELVDDAIELARRLLTTSLQDESRREVRRRERLGALLADVRGRQLIFAMTDQVLRIDDPALAADRFADVVGHHHTNAVGHIDALLLRVGAAIAPRLPRVVMPLVVRRIKAETHGIVIPADDPKFASHLERRADDGVAINVNPLGEAILSDAEADERFRLVLERIGRDDVDYVSVKVSSIVANLDALAFELSLDRICDRLNELYRAAESAPVRTFVNLDMEEYRDLELTVQSFMLVLDADEFAGIDAGIVMQAYLPDTHDAVDRLGTWAMERHARAGGTVKVRLVKGANLAMEAVEAEIHGWTPAPYASKADVDASYKAMLDSLLRPEWGAVVRVGLASHNLFDIAWALTLGADGDMLDRIEFEMLEGMAPAQARAVHAAAGRLLMYAPVVADDDFDASIAYLSRRLDENTQPDNFLRSLFTLTPDSPEYDIEAARFRTAVSARVDVDRSCRRAPLPVDVTVGSRFVAEPESDLTDASTRRDFLNAVAQPPAPAFERVDDSEAVDVVMSTATEAHARDEYSFTERRGWLLAAADRMSAERAKTIGLMSNEVAKTIHEGDPEISEAIDFCRYYATTGSDRLDGDHAGLAVSGRGVVVVVGPWNFPYAIPTGGVAGALAAGNSVVLKPAPEATAVGAWIADQFWRSGVPRDVLQLVVCEDGPVGKHLVTHPDVDTIVLTGAYETASMFLDWRPDLRVLAETSGKGALVITPSADIDEAIRDLVRSAFGHAGQKCSAASLGIVVAEVYDDPTFQRRLRDAVTSLRIGAAAEPGSMVGPLIAPPAGKLARALTTLDVGESWLVEPRRLDTAGAPAGTSWSPGVRLGVRADSWFHRTECFGPVLGLMRADDLDEAIAMQNASDLGLTGGIHSLDDAEVEHWLANVEIGNAYINRHITGAIVERQPFGGWKRSSIGGGSKAGGPGYVAQLARITAAPPTEAMDITSSFRQTWDRWYAIEHDATELIAEANILRYFPLDHVVARIADDNDDELIATLRAAAAASGVRLDVSSTNDETDIVFADRLAASKTVPDRVRLLTALSNNARRILHGADIAIDVDEPVTDPMIELNRWVREQAISRTRHRHGRLLA
jgi:RHH-type proline utilization regulon transcriptional repressor/proline dehydrogenase/delta 1-pyrroline-5-carboxylate dehydrogenase